MSIPYLVTYVYVFVGDKAQTLKCFGFFKDKIKTFTVTSKVSTDRPPKMI